jgi:hypothetical protein
VPVDFTHSTADEQVLIRLAHQAGLGERAERFRREPKDRSPLEQAALLALLDDLQGCGLVTCEVAVRLTPAARALVGDVEQPAPDAVIVRERPPR